MGALQKQPVANGQTGTKPVMAAGSFLRDLDAPAADIVDECFHRLVAPARDDLDRAVRLVEGEAASVLGCSDVRDELGKAHILDVANTFVGLVAIDESSVVVAFRFDESEKVVIEREQNPVVFQGQREMDCVRPAEQARLTGGMDLPIVSS